MILQTRRAMQKARRREIFPYGVTNEEAGVLVVARAIGPRATPTEIARWVTREPHSISTIVKRMEKRGLINRVNDPDRKNIVRVALTEKGEQVHHLLTERHCIYRIMSVLSEEEYQQLRITFEKLWAKAREEIGMRSRPGIPPAK